MFNLNLIITVIQMTKDSELFTTRIKTNHKGQYIKYVGGGPEGFCGGHEIFQAYIDGP